MNRAVGEVLDLVCGLSDPQSASGLKAQADLLAEGKLSVEMTAWGLRTTLARYTEETLCGLVQTDLRGATVGLSLAQSVPTAALRAIVLPLLRGADRVLVRPSSHQTKFADTIIERLSGVEKTADPTSSVDLVIAYGGDETLERIESTLAEWVRFEGHGHGFGAILIDDQPITDALVEAIAWDVCAYDQLGCLSPQVVFTTGDGAALARSLSAAIERCAGSFPRAPLGITLGARVMQWHGRLAATGAQVLRTKNGSVAWVDQSVMIDSPGGRNIAVVKARSPDDIQRVLTPHACFLSCVGLNTPAMRSALPREVRARVAALGTMQDPALDGPEDPRPPFRRR